MRSKGKTVSTAPIVGKKTGRSLLHSKKVGGFLLSSNDGEFKELKQFGVVARVIETEVDLFRRAKAKESLESILEELESPVSSETETSDHSIVWPSGHGHEIGTVKASIGEILLFFMTNYKKIRQKVHFINDDGVTACVFRGLKEGPVTFVADETGQSNLLSIVADSDADVQTVRGALKRIFGTKVKLSFHSL